MKSVYFGQHVYFRYLIWLHQPLQLGQIVPVGIKAHPISPSPRDFRVGFATDHVIVQTTENKNDHVHSCTCVYGYTDIFQAYEKKTPQNSNTKPVQLKGIYSI